MAKINSRKRVSVSLDSELAEMLVGFARKEDKTPTSKALEYIKIGLKNDEDRYWSAVAEKAYDEFIASGEPGIPLEDIWKKHIGSDFPEPPTKPSNA